MIVLDPVNGRGDIAVKDLLYQNTVINFYNLPGKLVHTGTNCVPFTFDSGASFDFSRTQSDGLTMFSWAAGAGLDYKWQIDPGSAVIFGVKYLQYGFGNNTLTLADNQFGSGASFGINTKEPVNVVTGRVSYLFSIH